MNRLNNLFKNKKERIRSIYFTAGYPNLNDTSLILENLQLAGADCVQIGIPFSDPASDAPAVQLANLKALQNGMQVKLLFQQLAQIRLKVHIPIVLTSYINPVLQYGIEAFCQKCQEVGIDGVILPDLPLEEYERQYKPIFEQYQIQNILLVTPQTAVERVKRIDAATHSFLYLVANISGIEKEQLANYLQRMQQLELNNPQLIGFDIWNKETFNYTCNYVHGAIIESAFVQHLAEHGTSAESIKDFMAMLQQ